MKNVLSVAVIFASLSVAAQVRTNQNISQNTIPSQTPFMDASSTLVWNSSTNLGKGLVFPQTDLTKLTTLVATPSGLPTAYPNRLDGMIVYNIATGTSAIGGVSVVPGFYYYENKSTSLNGGTWKAIGSNSTITGAGNLTGTGITVGNGNGAILKNVTLGIADNAITSAKIANGQVTADDLANGAVTATKLNAMGATTAGQVLKWNGTAWAPAADADTNTTYTAGNGIAISGTTISLSTPVRTVMAAYTLAAADNNGYVYVNSTAPVTVTVPSALPAGFSCVIVQKGTGQVTIAGGGVTLETARGTKTRQQFSAVGVIKDTGITATITGDAVK